MDETLQIQLAGAAVELEQAIDAQLDWSKEKSREGEWRFAALARNLSLYEDNQFWRVRGHASMNEFLELKADQFEVSRGTMYNAAWIGRKLTRFLTDEEMRRIGKSKLSILARATQEGDAPRRDFVDLALTDVKVETFEEAVRSNRPLLTSETQQDLDTVKVGPFFITRAERESFNGLVKLIQRNEGVTGRNLVFALMVERCLAEWTAEESAEMAEEGIVPRVDTPEG